MHSAEGPQATGRQIKTVYNQPTHIQEEHIIIIASGVTKRVPLY